MFERFTDRARRVVVLAQEEARALNHNYIGTEHLLLGLIHEEHGVACKALEALDISLPAIRAKVDEIVGPGGTLPTGHLPFTPRAKKVIELSLRESLKLGHNYIGTEHLLLGMIREGEGIACQVLVALGADLDRVRQQVIQLLQGYGGPGKVRAIPAVGEAELELLRASADPSLFPLCPICNASLVGSLRFRDLPAHGDGEAGRRVLVLYCGTCGRAIDSFLPPGTEA